ncbi:MAG: hypothetical protein D8M28_02465 [Proteobacteria bacterium]|nr:hypothetical protein [Pseudomonadota bacterium]
MFQKITGISFVDGYPKGSAENLTLVSMKLCASNLHKVGQGFQGQDEPLKRWGIVKGESRLLLL